jgi:hypothetical protein
MNHSKSFQVKTQMNHPKTLLKSFQVYLSYQVQNFEPNEYIKLHV